MHGPEGRLGPAGGKNWGMGKKRKNSAPSSGFGKRQMGNARGYAIYVPRAAYLDIMRRGTFQGLFFFCKPMYGGKRKSTQVFQLRSNAYPSRYGISFGYAF
ncbi:uncharacterized protein LAJ45_00222 [Morchella importuna]|uniref:uncharacterized protein n=1 Tax=Morchella importuna TaxID=1174673 RepID=UPI001E8D1646|nr:uncharacterized protein LAJ45_00222 [Morchella importuna]KAH8155213.1 hypothetical protein LAJ45_00222 [Morchella importuna]